MLPSVAHVCQSGSTCSLTLPSDEVTFCASDALRVDNHLVKATLLFIHRLPDCTPSPYSAYFAKKRRFWEIRWQATFKALPETGTVYFGAEVREPLPEYGYLARTAASLALAFARRITSLKGVTLECNFGNNNHYFEPHYLLFPMQSADVLIITDSNTAPPSINHTGDMAELDGFICKQPGPVNIELGKTYTLCFYTMYASILDWTLTSIPGVSGLCISNLVGKQPIHAVVRDKPDHPAVTISTRLPLLSSVPENSVSIPDTYYVDVCFHHERCCPLNAEPGTPGFRSAVSSTDYQALIERRGCWSGVWDCWGCVERKFRSVMGTCWRP